MTVSMASAKPEVKRQPWLSPISRAIPVISGNSPGRLKVDADWRHRSIAIGSSIRGSIGGHVGRRRIAGILLIGMGFAPG
jgi:hypothetical protein